MKTSTWLATILLALIACGHLVRLVLRLEVTAGGVRIPLWISILACLAAGGIAIMLWRDSRRT